VSPDAERRESRWRFLRDVAVFQAKLVLDGLRDAVMIPLSLAAAVIDLLVPGGETSGLFYRLVALGRRTERWIDLFEAADRVEPRAELRDEGGVDEVFRKIEGFLGEQERKGGLTASARARVDRLLDAVSSPEERR